MIKTHFLLVSALVGILSVSASSQTDTKPQATPAASASSEQMCPIDSSQPTASDGLLARKSYKEAEAGYRDALTKQQDKSDARLGIVRALIGEDKVVEAQAEASAFLQAEPKSALAEVANSEAAYRAGDIDSAFSHAKAAVADNSCEGRAFTVLADMYDLSALFATGARYAARAHNLRPNDELILRDWIDSLPRKQRQEEVAKYLGGDHALSTDDTRDYSNELEHLKARKSGECRITSKADVTKTRMQPVYGDNQKPVAYGLDVSFDGKRRRMQIDTGASGILLTQSAARGLGLQPEYHLKTGGIGDEGDLDSYLTHVHSIQIGDVEVSDCMVEVVAKSKLDVDGLIGMDVFDRWLVTLDYQAAEVRLSPLPPRPGAQPAKKLESDSLPGDIGDQDGTPKDRYVAAEMKDWLVVPRIGHQILLPTFLKKDGPVHYLIMDTGAGSSSLSLPVGREAGKLHSSDVDFIGLSGKTKKVYETDRTPLFVSGRLALAAEQYYAYDITRISHENGFEVGGLLGLPTLQRLTLQIDYRDNLLKLTYDPNRDLQRF